MGIRRFDVWSNQSSCPSVVQGARARPWGCRIPKKKNKLPTPDLRHVPFDRWSGAVKASAPTEHSVVLPRLRSTFGEGPALKG